MSDTTRGVPDPTGRIDVGASSDCGLRLWRAKEAVRQGEARLGSQAASLASLEGRAQAMVGWAAAAATVLGGAVLTSTVELPLRVAAGCALAAMLHALVQGWIALRPSDWCVAGHDPDEIMNGYDDAEVYDLESMAGGYAVGLRKNRERLVASGNALSRGLLSMAAAPVAGLPAGVIFWGVTR